MRYIAILMTLALGQVALAQNVGVQAIGLEKFAIKDVDILAGQLATVRRPIEVALLPFEFNGTSFAGTQAVGFDDLVFNNTRRLTTYVLDNNPSTFTLSIHLYFAHSGDNRTIFRYGAFDRKANGDFVNNEAKDVSFRNEMRARTLRTGSFLNGLWSWANQKGIVSRLRLVTIPELEDSATSSQWSNCQRFIQETYASIGTITLYRRSAQNSRQTGFPNEKHGGTSVISELHSGDVYSNDGYDIGYLKLPTTTSNTISHSTFVSKASAAVRNGKTALYWRNTFNGPRGTSPNMRSVLTPFSDATNGPNEQTALWIFLNTY